MNSFLLFLIKSTLSLSLLYLTFSVLMRKETFFKLNRMVLLVMVLSSLLIPLLYLPQPMQPIAQVYMEPIFRSNSIPTGPVQMNESPISIQSSVTSQEINRPVTVSIQTILFFIYLSGVIVSLLMLVYSICSVLLLFRRARQMDQVGYRLMIVDNELAAFSFGRTILISQHDYDTNAESIITHEQSHIRLGHFYDLMLLETVKVIFWFNPLVYRLMNDLKEIHEFQADDCTLNQGIDATQYQLLIIQKCVGHQKFALANSFNHCQIKNRITMMNKQKTSKAGLWKVATFLPLLALLLMAFGKTGEKVQKNIQPEREMLNQEKTIVIESATQDRDSIYSTPEVMPQFPGGEEALRKFINENIHYSETKLKEYFKGKVLMEKGFVAFVINSQGKVINIRLIKSINNELDSAALRAIRLMPDWIPAKDKGKPVSASYTLPMNWILWDVKTTETQTKTQSDDKIYSVVEVNPEFPGGINAMKEYIAKGIQYPREAEAKGIQGKVYVTFEVNKEGKVLNSKVLKTANPALNAEAIRVIQSMPNWTPGKQNGVPVRVSYTVPINFVLEPGSSTKSKVVTPSPNPNKDDRYVWLGNNGTLKYDLVYITFDVLAEKVKSDLQNNPKLRFDIMVEEGNVDKRVSKVENVLKSNGNPKVRLLSFHIEKGTDSKGLGYVKITSKPMEIK